VTPSARPRSGARLVVGALIGLGALGVAVYFLNPLHSPSRDPRFRVLGLTLYRIPSSSMEPTIHRNGIFVVSAWAYRHADPRAGDIIVFQYPLDASVMFVKRVIATGGSTVEIVDGETRVDGRTVAEPYVDGANRRTPVSLRMALQHVPPNNYFVMGDNRDNSDDSRWWGFVPRDKVLGRMQ